MDDTMQMFLTFCGSIVTVGGACAVLWKWILPPIKLANKLSNRVKSIEEKEIKRDSVINDLVEGNSLMLECMIYVIRNARTNNSVKDLERMETKVMEYVTSRGGNA